MREAHNLTISPLRAYDSILCGSETFISWLVPELFLRCWHTIGQGNERCPSWDTQNEVHNVVDGWSRNDEREQAWDH
jgi:hypothetical protein